MSELKLRPPSRKSFRKMQIPRLRPAPALCAASDKNARDCARDDSDGLRLLRKGPGPLRPSFVMAFVMVLSCQGVSAPGLQK
jgi:hypothetical protein